MDNAKQYSYLALCAGYDGIGIGLKKAGVNIGFSVFVEVEAFASYNLAKKIESGSLGQGVIWPDLKTFPYADFHGCFDILSAGFPCQPFSLAGKRKAVEDPRHLFPHIIQGIISARPKLVFLENVEGIISAKLSGTGWNDPAGTPVLLHVLRELERIGYKATWGIFSAAKVGAPHQRKRVFILACDNNKRGTKFMWEISAQTKQYPTRCGCNYPSRPGEQQYEWEPPRTVGNSKSNNKCGTSEPTMHREGIAVRGSGGELPNPDSIRHDGREIPNRNQKRSIQEQTRQQDELSMVRRETQGCNRDGQTTNPSSQSSMGGDSYGASDWLDYAKLCKSSDNRIDELRLLGNGVVPDVATKAFITLLDELTNENRSM